MTELLSLKGVGPKVADCVALFSLDCHDVVPIDTHMWQIYKAKYQKNKTAKGSQNMKYDAVKAEFRKIFGEWAGVIHSFLFTSQLKEFDGKQKSKSVASSIDADIPKKRR